MSVKLSEAFIETSPKPADVKAIFFDLSLDLLCILDVRGTIQEVNRALLTMLRSDKNRLIGAPFADFVYPDDQLEVMTALNSFVGAGSPMSFVCRYLCYDDSLKWFLWTVYAYSIDRWHAVGRDITAYKQMEVKEVERNIFAEALLDTVLAINSSLALDQVLARILSNIGKVVAYEYVSIILVEADKAEIVGTQNIEQNYQREKGSKGKKFPIKDDRYLQQMFETHESIIITEIEQTPAWIVEAASSAVGALLGAPIVVEEKVIGFLCVFNNQKEFFTPLHAQQLVTFANQAGIAINNARLYEQAKATAILRERQRMAQELHDSVNQDLFAASTYADLLPKAITKKPQVVAKYATDISRLVRRAVDQMRMILIELHPDTLTNTGLEDLIRQLCHVFRRQTGLPLELNTSHTNTILEERVQITVYRIAQEALHNIDKHAKATSVKVGLHIAAAELTLSIEDDGCGFDQNTITDIQFGVSGMQERSYSIGADLVIESRLGEGTKIKLRKQIS